MPKKTDKKTLNVRDIIKNGYVSWKDVKRSIKYHYPKDKNDYEGLFHQLGKRRIVKTSPKETLVIEANVRDYTDPEVWETWKKFNYFESLKSEDEKEYYNVCIKKEGEELTYSCSFAKWSYMVSLPIDKETFHHHTMVDIVAHFLWEITFFGFEEEMEKRGKALGKVYKKIKKAEKEDRLSECITPFDESKFKNEKK